jgi:L-2-hydroxyglutarate oxidase LhgO
MESCGAVVIGAGVVGLAIARALALSGKDTLILERNARPGMETSSRNSEVIHAGLYYPQGSLKAALCVEGRDLLYSYCAARCIAHRRLGKLIFATEADQYDKLHAIQSAAHAAGVYDLQWLDGRDARRLEPDLTCRAALLSPSTGIIDAHDYMQGLLGDATNEGAIFVPHTEVEAVSRKGSDWLISIVGERAPVVSTPILVNAAGLGAQQVAAAIHAFSPSLVPPLHLARGAYFACTKKLPFRHLLYPVPVPGGLGTHLTLDLNGAARFGPDVEWIDKVDYRVDPGRHASFLEAARLIYPRMQAEDIVTGFSGIRPKLSGPGEGAADFVISSPIDHGLSGLVNLFGIESPGLTASLAIADHVMAALEGH